MGKDWDSSIRDGRYRGGHKENGDDWMPLNGGGSVGDTRYRPKKKSDNTNRPQPYPDKKKPIRHSPTTIAPAPPEIFPPTGLDTVFLTLGKLSFINIDKGMFHLTLKDKLKFASVSLRQLQFMNFRDRILKLNQSHYGWDVKEYPNKVKMFFVPGTSNRKVPMQNLNIQTSTIKTYPKVFVERYGAIHDSPLLPPDKKPFKELT